MPVCVVCGNRPFTVKEALQQHLRTSSNPHPFCLPCDRRFVSESAYNAHMAAKHPPTFDCLRCNKQYNAQFALEDHYRGHTVHPNCTVCGRGFYDNVALDAHIHEAHIDLRCDVCNLQFESTSAANTHYAKSPAHPNCDLCGVGFRDAQSLEQHMAGPPHAPEPTPTHARSPDTLPSEADTPTGHSPPFTLLDKPFQSPPTTTASAKSLSPLGSLQREDLPILQPTATQGFVSSPPLGLIGNGMQLSRNMSATSYGGTGFSPLSPKPNIFNKDLRRVAAIDTTTRADSPDLAQAINVQGSPLLNVQAPIFSPVSLPKPGRQIDELWSSRENIQIPQNRIPRQPSLPSSVTNAKLQTWSTPQTGPTVGSVIQQQTVPYTNYRYQALPPRHRAASDLGTGATSPPDNISTPTVFSRHTSTASETRFTARTEYKFNPRLYPGSARYATAQSLSIQPGLQAIVPTHKGNDSGNVGNDTKSSGPGLSMSSPPRSSYGNPFDIGFRQPTSLLSLPLPPSSVTSTNHQNHSPPTSSPFIRSKPTPQDKENQWKDKESDILDYATAMEKGQRQTQTFKDDISILSVVSTPRLVSDAPLHEFGIKPGTNESPGGGGGILPSPSDFSSISSVSSSVPPMSSPTPVGRRETERACSRSRAASSARSDISSLNIPTYRITASSEQATPISPDVVSPIGLVALPVISPLAPTPIDIDGAFDIPEAQQPLPDSIPPSPITICEIFDGEQEASQEAKTNGSLNGSPGATGKPEEKDVAAELGNIYYSNGTLDAGHMDAEPESLSSPCSPQSFMTSPQELAAEEQETPKKDFNEDDPRSLSRPASARSTLLQVVTEDTKQRNTPDLIVKSPSPSPFPITPKDDEGSPTLSQIVSPTIQAPLSSPKRQHLVAPPLGFTPNTSIASSCRSDGSGEGTSPSSLLHCRACRRETPDDITATMCGHVFCNRCITDAVIKTSRCPLCSTPTLLYCLFRLDLAT